MSDFEIEKGKIILLTTLGESDILIAIGCIGGNMDKKVTIYSIAQELGYTPSMVSRALSENGKVSEDKRKKVIELAKKYNFVPNKFASRMSKSEIKIGCILVSRTKRIEEEMIKGFKKAFSDLCDYKIQYEVIAIDALYNSDAEKDLEKALLKFIKFDGLIISGMGDKRFTEVLKKFKLPKLVFLQTVNEEIPYLFASKHNERLAAECASDFLFSARCKNVFLFTGNQDSSLHLNAKEVFLEKSKFNVKGVFDMRDDEKILEENVEKLITDDIDGIYITSGNSLALCEFLRKTKKDIALVCTDTYKELNQYFSDNVIDMTIDQNISGQAFFAFYGLCMNILKDKQIEKNSYTEFKLKTKAMVEA